MFLERYLNENLDELLLRAGFCFEIVYFAEAARLNRKCHTELLTSRAAISLKNTRLVEGIRRLLDDVKKAAEHVKKSLREKEVLIKEIHHRVKNNLQIIQIVLSLQLPFIKDGRAAELFKESQNRVGGCALANW